MSCYEQFGWGPEQVRALPYTEAILLAVYFEEMAHFQAERNKELESRASAASASGYETEFEVGMDEGFDEDDDG